MIILYIYNSIINKLRAFLNKTTLNRRKGNKEMFNLVVTILLILSLMVHFQAASSFSDNFSDKIAHIRSQLSQLTEQHAQLEADGQAEEAEKLRSELAQLVSYYLTFCNLFCAVISLYYCFYSSLTTLWTHFLIS